MRARWASATISKAKRVLVTAGPTCEDLDPVRYLTNRSSGQDGLRARRRGRAPRRARGAGQRPHGARAPAGVERVAVRSTEEMHRAVLAHWPATIVIMAAAVADYRPVAPQAQKIKRGGERLVLELEPTLDILADVSAKNDSRESRRAKAPIGSAAKTPRERRFIVVGFAAETDHVAEHARQKLAAKSADMIVANDVTAEGAGFDHDTNMVTIFTRDGAETPLPRMSKLEVAERVFDRVLELRSARPVTSAPQR